MFSFDNTHPIVTRGSRDSRAPKHHTLPAFINIHGTSFSGLKQSGGPPSTPSKSSTGKGKDVVHQLKVTLEEMFNGTKKKLALNRKELCLECNGAGGSVRTEFINIF